MTLNSNTKFLTLYSLGEEVSNYHSQTRPKPYNYEITRNKKYVFRFKIIRSRAHSESRHSYEDLPAETPQLPNIKQKRGDDPNGKSTILNI